MKPTQSLPDGVYPFREDEYPLSELSLSEAPPDLAAILVAQAEANGVALLRDVVVELKCRVDGIDENRFTVYWPTGDVMHLLVPKKYVVGRA
jgi:hypothetical protein